MPLARLRLSLAQTYRFLILVSEAMFFAWFAEIGLKMRRRDSAKMEKSKVKKKEGGGGCAGDSLSYPKGDRGDRGNKHSA